MRRAFTAILAAASLITGFSAVPALAQGGDRDRYEYGSDHARYDHGDRRGYWERPGDRRGRSNRHSHRRRDHHAGVHYYPGYGYYPSAGHRDRPDRCARRYRSYDERSGTYVGHDGARRHCS